MGKGLKFTDKIHYFTVWYIVSTLSKSKKEIKVKQEWQYVKRKKVYKK